MPNACSGQVIGTVPDVKDKMECLQLCQGNSAECDWFTYDGSLTICNLYATCPILNDCHTCVSGRRKSDEK